MLAVKRVGYEESRSSVACLAPVSIPVAGWCCSCPSRKSVPLGLLERRVVGACSDVMGKRIGGDRALRGLPNPVQRERGALERGKRDWADEGKSTVELEDRDGRGV